MAPGPLRGFFSFLKLKSVYYVNGLASLRINLRPLSGSAWERYGIGSKADENQKDRLGFS